jgi:hypothetical protein
MLIWHLTHFGDSVHALLSGLSVFSIHETTALVLLLPPATNIAGFLGIWEHVDVLASLVEFQ